MVVWDFFHRRRIIHLPKFTQSTCQAFRSSLALRRFQGKKRCLRQGRRRLSWNTAFGFLTWFGSFWFKIVFVDHLRFRKKLEKKKKCYKKEIYKYKNMTFILSKICMNRICCTAGQKVLQETVTSVVPLLEVQGLVPTAIKAVDGSGALPFQAWRKGCFSCKGTRYMVIFR